MPVIDNIEKYGRAEESSRYSITKPIKFFICIAFTFVCKYKIYEKWQYLSTIHITEYVPYLGPQDCIFVLDWSVVDGSKGSIRTGSVRSIDNTDD